MRGIIATYQPVAAIGTINTSDGNSYVFALDDIASSANIMLGQVVDFKPNGSRATEIKTVGAVSGAVASAMFGFNFKRSMFSFKGRLSRQDYWLGTLINVFAQNLFGFIPILGLLLWLLALWPALAVAVKRLHDIGRTGWYVLVPVISAIGSAAVLIYGTWEFSGLPQTATRTDYGTLIPYLLGSVALLLIYLAFIVALGLIKGQAADNAYGPPTRRI